MVGSTAPWTEEPTGTGRSCVVVDSREGSPRGQEGDTWSEGGWEGSPRGQEGDAWSQGGREGSSMGAVFSLTGTNMSASLHEKKKKKPKI